jgi:hypothetical protein
MWAILRTKGVLLMKVQVRGTWEKIAVTDIGKIEKLWLRQ